MIEKNREKSPFLYFIFTNDTISIIFLQDALSQYRHLNQYQ